MTDLLKEVDKKKIFQEIVKQIHQLIKNGSLKAGDRLPPERDLAELFKVSRASVREAIRYLESAGLVRARVGDGTYIETASLENLVEPLATVITGERENLAELFAIRKMIEPQLTGLAARNITDQQLIELGMILVRKAIPTIPSDSPRWTSCSTSTSPSSRGARSI
jgi:GntR family transcriptional repressor for pyruvate dehydrogenase complex